MLLTLQWVGGMRYAAALSQTGRTGAPSYAHAGVPFFLWDRYAAQFCIATRSGRVLLPLVVPASGSSPDAFTSTLVHVQAGVPFVVRDDFATLHCVSTRGGQLLPPFMAP